MGGDGSGGLWVASTLVRNWGEQRQAATQFYFGIRDKQFALLRRVWDWGFGFFPLVSLT